LILVVPALGPDAAIGADAHRFRPQVTAENDELVSAIVAHGDADSIASSAATHLAAGADHVILMPPVGGAADFLTGTGHLDQQALALDRAVGVTHV
jgi:hypothetical protein